MSRGTRLIFLYGPPGVGKFTIGKRLARLTGFPLYHNHLTVDLLLTFFPFGSPSFKRVGTVIRNTLFQELAKSRIPGFIKTFVWCFEHDAKTIQSMVDAIHRGGGRVHFVELVASRTVLLRRIQHASRLKYKKVRSRALLQRLLQEHMLNAPTAKARSRGTLVIHTDRTTPAKAAEKIVRRFHLPRKTKVKGSR